MLVVSICGLSPVILSVLCLRLDGGLDETGNCALLHKDNSTEKIISDIGRKSLKSSSFMLKSAKIVFLLRQRCRRSLILRETRQFRCFTDLGNHSYSNLVPSRTGRAEIHLVPTGIGLAETSKASSLRFLSNFRQATGNCH